MNPFDQFAVTLNDALPPQQQPPPSSSSAAAATGGGGDGTNGMASHPHPHQQQQFNLMAPPAPERKSVMNVPGMMMMPPQQPHPQQQPPMMYGQQQPQQSMMYGGQPPPQPQGMFGSQQQSTSSQGIFGGQQQQQWPSQNNFGTIDGAGIGVGGAASTTAGGGGAAAGGGFGMPASTTNNVGQQSFMMTAGSMAGALVPSGIQSNPYALGPPTVADGNPFGPPSFPPQQQQQHQQQPLQPTVSMQQQQTADPFGFDSSPMRPPTQQPVQHQPPQFGGSTAMVPMDPFGMAPPPTSSVPQQRPQPLPQQQQQQQQLALDPWGGGGFEGGIIQQSQQPPPPTTSSMALVPTSMPSDDPFGIFGGGGGGGFSGGGGPSAPPSNNNNFGAPPPSAMPPANDDPWADMGFGPSSASAPPPPPPNTTTTGPIPGVDDDLFNATLQPTRDDNDTNSPPSTSTPSSPRKGGDGSKRKKGELPPGGEWYDAKIFTPTLGVMFFKPKELLDSLFLQTDKKLVDALDERPVVAFIVEGSSARSAGVELGHVLLKVNGIDVKNPKEASRLIKEGPRPLPLLFYVPETSVVVAEGEHMVKYNTKDTTAPNSAKDWKPKYVVVGGIIAQPWIMNMYRSKSEYDIAVIETQARRPISVKVKQFSLQGARIQNDWQGPQMVKYKNKLHPWKYIVVLPVARNPIKIGAPNLSQLKPVHEGIRRVLQAQQNRASGGGGGGGHVVVASPVRGPSDPYRSGGGGGYDGRDENGQGNHRDRADNSAYGGHGY